MILAFLFHCHLQNLQMGFANLWSATVTCKTWLNGELEWDKKKIRLPHQKEKKVSHTAGNVQNNSDTQVKVDCLLNVIVIINCVVLERAENIYLASCLHKIHLGLSAFIGEYIDSHQIFDSHYNTHTHIWRGLTKNPGSERTTNLTVNR